MPDTGGGFGLMVCKLPRANCCSTPIIPPDCPYTVTDCNGVERTVNGRFGALKIEAPDGRLGDQPYNLWIQEFYYDLTETLNAGETIDQNGRTFTVEAINCSAAVCRCVARLVYVDLYDCPEDVEVYYKTHVPGCDNGAEKELVLSSQAVVWQHSSSTGNVLGAEKFQRMYRFYLEEKFVPAKDTIVWWNSRGFRVEDEIDVDRPRRWPYLLAREIAWQPSTTCVNSNES